MIAFAIHQINAGGRKTFVFIIETEIRDQIAVRRNFRRVIRAAPIGQFLDGAIFDIDFVNLGIERFVFMIRVAIRDRQNVRAVGRPLQLSPGTKIRKAIVKIAARDLPRGPPSIGTTNTW